MTETASQERAELAGNGQDVVVATAQPTASQARAGHRVKKPAKLSAKSLETIALGKKLTPFLTSFMFAALGPVIKDLRTRLKTAEREHTAVLHRLAAAENIIADRREITKIKEKFAEVEDALANAMSFQGTWEADRVYRRGACVSHSGSLWFALTESVDLRPGSGSKAWKMTMKSGAWHDD